MTKVEEQKKGLRREASFSVRLGKTSFVFGVAGLLLGLALVGLIFSRQRNEDGKTSDLLTEVKQAFDVRFPEFESNQLLREVEQAMKDRAIRKKNRPKTESPGRPGTKIAKHKIADNPVVIVPGITSVALELWKGKSCAPNFRERWWGSAHMAVNAMTNHQCWLEHLVMNNTNWGDPEGVKVRPVSGMAATEYLFPGFFVWAKVIENLADVGYEPNNMYVATYDWRLPPRMCETRDMYFTGLAAHIEQMKKLHKKKVALVCHSMGCLWVFYFLNFASRGLGAVWLEDNLDTVVNIAPSMLGVPKALGAIFSGDIKDSAEFGQIGREIMNRMLGSRKVPRMMRSVGSIASMLPMGSDAVWGEAMNGTTKMVTFVPGSKEQIPFTCSAGPKGNEMDEVLMEPVQDHHVWADMVSKNMSKSEALEALENVAPRYAKLMSEYFETKSNVAPNAGDFRQWTNPALLPLPAGTGHLRIFCLYGLLEEHTTETGYTYQIDSNLLDSAMPLVLAAGGSESEIPSGIRLGPGDGSVPLVSLGHVCARWQRGVNNPEGAKVIIREHREQTPPRAMHKLLGGGDSADHVEILGHSGVLEDLLEIVTRSTTGTDSEVHDRVFSNIQEMTDAILQAEK